MPKMLNDGAVEYEDGIPATEAQVSLPYFTKVVTKNLLRQVMHTYMLHSFSS